MDKLLKHFGLGGKKSPAHQSYRSDCGPQNSDSIQDLDLKGVRLPTDCNYGTERRVVVDHREPYDIRRSNSDYSRTLPTSGDFRAADLTKEQNWSLHRGKIARQVGHSASLKEKEPSVKNLGAEGEAPEDVPAQVEAEEACQTVRQLPVKPIPLSDDYSDPYDLRKQAALVTTASVQEPEEVKAIPAADPSEGDYSVPYDLKIRNIDCVELKDPEKAPVMYDDPYEESPLMPIALSCASAAKCQQQQQHHPYQQQQQLQQQFHHQQQLIQQQLQQQLQGLDMSEKKSTCTQTSSVVKDASRKSLESKDECMKKVEQPTCSESTGKVLSNGLPVIAPKFYQLSAEYGGIDIPDDEDDDDDVGHYTDLQEEGILAEHLGKPVEEPFYPEGVMLPPVARHARIPLPLGTYEEPWDLSVTQRSFEDRLQSKRPTADAMTSSVTLNDPRSCDGLMSRSCHAESLRQDDKGKETKNPESTFPVYGVPWSIRPKDGKRVQGKAADTPTAGVAKVKVPVRSSSLRPVDSRPMEDYDEPWDQKKKLICKTVSDVNGRSGSMTSTHSSHHIANTWSATLAEQIDTKLPLDKQPWYHANISRVEAENLLRVHGEGSYLVRNSESNKKDFSLSVKSARGFMHMKIVASPDGRFILGQFSQPFSNIAQVILHYTVHKLPIKGAEHMSLIFPVPNKLL